MRKLALAQGAYFIATGLWPLVHFSSFAIVTNTEGPAWAFRAIGLLIACIGLALLSAARVREFGAAICHLGALSAMALAWIDVELLRQGVIGSLNELDVPVQLAFALAWLVLASKRDPKIYARRARRPAK